MDFKKYEDIASRIRIDIIKAVHKAGSGHPGGSLSAADIVTALYFKVMNIDPANPRMEGRDKFILSKGHAGPVQYAALAERGYYGVEDMMSLRKLGSRFFVIRTETKFRESKCPQDRSVRASRFP